MKLCGQITKFYYVDIYNEAQNVVGMYLSTLRMRHDGHIYVPT